MADNPFFQNPFDGNPFSGDGTVNPNFQRRMGGTMFNAGLTSQPRNAFEGINKGAQMLVGAMMMRDANNAAQAAGPTITGNIGGQPNPTNTAPVAGQPQTQNSGANTPFDFFGQQQGGAPAQSTAAQAPGAQPNSLFGIFPFFGSN